MVRFVEVLFFILTFQSSVQVGSRMNVQDRGMEVLVHPSLWVWPLSLKTQRMTAWWA